jgi:lysophospholipase L1-like esterase
MRIVFLGDSLTWGGYGGNFVDAVQKQMPEHEIINAGVAGDTVVNLLRRVENVLTETKPDALFVMVGGNDATSYSQPKTRGYYRKVKQPKMVLLPQMNLGKLSRFAAHNSLAFVRPLIDCANRI